jgi:hypothetical protein
MPKLRPLLATEVARLLRAHGFTLVHQRGSHLIEALPHHLARQPLNPERIASLSPALDRRGQRGDGPTLGQRRSMTIKAVASFISAKPERTNHNRAVARSRLGSHFFPFRSLSRRSGRTAARTPTGNPVRRAKNRADRQLLHHGRRARESETGVAGGMVESQQHRPNQADPTTPPAMQHQRTPFLMFGYFM